jgi:NAD-dependent deacetylase
MTTGRITSQAWCFAMGTDMRVGPDGEALRIAKRRIREAGRIIVLTGAGVSAESGVPTFRGPGGLWRNYRPEDLATQEAFARDPRLVWEWYAWRRENIAAISPNAAHRALASLEARIPEFVLVTQNVDGLHQTAGSRRIVELHGSIWNVRCVSCGVTTEERRVPMPRIPPVCACGGLLRPGVVWFGENLPPEALTEAFTAAGEAEVTFVIGTSAVVFPAAAIPQIAHGAGSFLIEVNPETTPLTPIADVSLRGTAVEWVPSLVGI